METWPSKKMTRPQTIKEISYLFCHSTASSLLAFKTIMQSARIQHQPAFLVHEKAGYQQTDRRTNGHFQHSADRWLRQTQKSILEMMVLQLQISLYITIPITSIDYSLISHGHQLTSNCALVSSMIHQNISVSVFSVGL